MDERVKAALRFIEVMTLRPTELGTADMEKLRAVGLDDRAIEDVIQVTAGFNIIPRIADALEFEIPDWPTFLKGAALMKKRGYR